MVNSLEADTFSDSLKRYLSRELEEHLKHTWKTGRINVSSVETSSLCRVSVSNEGGSIAVATESEEDAAHAAQDAFSLFKADGGAGGGGGGGGGGGNDAAPAEAAEEAEEAEAASPHMVASGSHDDLEDMEAIRARFQTEERISLERQASAAFQSSDGDRGGQFQGAVQRMKSHLTPLSPETRLRSNLSLPALSSEVTNPNPNPNPKVTPG